MKHPASLLEIPGETAGRRADAASPRSADWSAVEAATRLFELRRQHVEWARLGYDGHNRRPLRTTRKSLRHRRLRRRFRRSLSLFCAALNARPAQPAALRSAGVPR